jgi:hypothetical protein
MRLHGSIIVAEPEDGFGLSYMSAQAVRMSIDSLLKTERTIDA